MKKIVILRRGGLGDFIVGTVPLCHYLEERYGECEFHFFMNASNIGIAKYYYPEAKTYLIPKGNRLVNHIKYGLKYRFLRPDIGAITYPDFPRFNSLFMFAIGAKERYGRIGKSLIARLLLTHATDLYPEVDLAEDHVGLCAIRTFDPSITNLEKKYYPHFRMDLLKMYNAQNEGIHIMVELSNNRPWCQLSVEKTAEILNVFAEQHDFTVFITAKTTDSDKAKNLKARLKMPAEFYLSPSLDDFLSFVGSADMVVCGDGGLAHVATTMNKYVVALFAKTPAYHWGPLGGDRLHVILEKEHVDKIENEIILKAMDRYYEDIKRSCC